MCELKICIPNLCFPSWWWSMVNHDTSPSILTVSLSWLLWKRLGNGILKHSIEFLRTVQWMIVQKFPLLDNWSSPHFPYKKNSLTFPTPLKKNTTSHGLDSIAPRWSPLRLLRPGCHGNDRHILSGRRKRHLGSAAGREWLPLEGATLAVHGWCVVSGKCRMEEGKRCMVLFGGRI